MSPLRRSRPGSALTHNADPPAPALEPARLRDSLRLRLPLLFGFLVIVMLATFLWAMYNEVESMLVESGADRAKVPAAELAASLSRSMASVLERQDALGMDPTVQAALRSPDDRTRDAARPALTPTATTQGSRVELWTPAGERVLEIVVAPADSTEPLPAFPSLDAPAQAGVSELHESDGYPFFAITTAVRDTAAAGAPLLGYLRRYGRLTTSPSGLVTRLLGDGAVLRVGSAGSAVWTDLIQIRKPAPLPTDGERAGRYRSPDGEQWVGASAAISSSPWVIWVGYPRSTVLAPLDAFLRRMMIGAVLFVLAGVLIGGILSRRITAPLHGLAGAAEQIAAGDYTRRVDNSSRDEIGRLSRAFNLMSVQVEEAHRELRDTSQLTQFALAAAQIGVWEADLADSGFTCSDSMALVHAVDVDALPDSVAGFLALVHPDDRGAVREMLEARQMRHGVFDVQYRAVRPDGAVRWMEGKGRVKLDDAGRAVAVLGVSMDVTDRQQLEALLRQSQKMEAIGQLAGGVAHDFNNLLTAIVGHGSMLLNDLPSQSAAHTQVTVILNAADSAARLTRQLLTFSRRTVIHAEVVSINDVIERTDTLLRRLIPAHVAMVTKLTPAAVTVRVDVSHLEQVIMNLALNARDAMPHGGTLTISSGVIELDGRESFAGETPAAGSWITLNVADTGIGMDEETRSHLFEPFFTTKPLGLGTGLGLATVFGIVRQSGGLIEVDSEPGAGTIFRVLLPAAAAADGADAVGARLSAADHPAGGRECILVVDDDTAVRTIARKILERFGYRVVTATSGEDALALLGEPDVRPSLVVTDIVMPGMNGAELYSRLAAAYPGLRVLFTSGYAADSLGRWGVDATPGTFIDKPYSPDELAARVREALDHRMLQA